MKPIDLCDAAIMAAVGRMIDEIVERARATAPHANMSARLIGRVLGLRLGIPTWQAQRIAKTHWQRRKAAR